MIGELDSLIRRRGYRINLRDVEASINKHPAVEGSRVTAQEDQRAISALVAYVELKPKSFLADWELHAFLNANLPSFMVPDAVVRIDALPSGTEASVGGRALQVPDWLAQNSYSPSGTADN